MSQYIAIHKDTKEVYGAYGEADFEGMVGPPTPPPELHVDNLEYHLWQGALFFGDAPSVSSKFLWSEQSPQWIETASIEELKSRKRLEITNARIAQDADHFVYMGKEIRTADKDMFDLLVADARIAKCIDTEMPPNWPGGWKAIDNSYLPISTKAAWNAFFIAAYDRGILNFLHSQELKRQLDDAVTAEEISAIKW